MKNSTLSDAVAALASEFFSAALSSGDFAGFERPCVEAGFAAIREAMSLAPGTIECDNATVYKSRMGGRRSWSRKGAAAMSRLLSLKASSVPLPGQRPAREGRVWEIPAGMPASEVVQSVGSGYEPPAGHVSQNCTHDHEFTDWVVNGNWR